MQVMLLCPAQFLSHLPIFIHGIITKITIRGKALRVHIMKGCLYMKRLIVFILVLVSIIGIVGCGKEPPKPVNTIEGNYKTYYEMSDGTWKYDDYSYKYRLEISGRPANAEKEVTYVYLSNIENISFSQAMMASGLSSNTKDYFSPEEAMLVEINLS